MFIIRVSGKIGREIGCDSGNGEPLQVSWNRQFRNNLCVFIPKSKGFSQSKLRLPVSTGILRISKLYPNYRYPNWQLSNQANLYFEYCKTIFVQQHAMQSVSGDLISVICYLYSEP
jgi:hypothetical protein